ncbi:hypothetical protein BE04_12830 [Sorangium cellulosum]|uniref:Cytochrome P460 domain-containing protein n=2 Tax=Sorangium cellulosum TaxID=56 RepID=A0A150PJL4_SORCE|nr:hypothetical protein SCE1572_15520 [Sorangium cellulosum So0157-2]KYF55862.1 hypothetical protein BE04_12830 [Sorangium cellulosum]KYG05607.1 hypothetical protein BE21_39635 [Sorangium cellulosum]
MAALASPILSLEASSRPRWAPLPLGCAPSRPRTPHEEATAWIERGSSPVAEPRATAVAPAASAPADPSAWELAGQLASFTPATGRARSQHFTGEMEAEVRINAAAAPYPALGPARALPPGAALVELHYPAGSSEPVTLLAMVKRPAGYDPDGGDWEYLVLTPQGTSTHRGALPLCKRCHADAPHDHLFGGPR